MLSHLEYYNFIQDHLVNPFVWDKPIFDAVTPAELAEFRKEIRSIKNQDNIETYHKSKKEAQAIIKRLMDKLELPKFVRIQVEGETYNVSIGKRIANESMDKIEFLEDLPKLADRLLMATYHLTDMLKAGIGDWESTSHNEPNIQEKRKNFLYARSAKPFIVQNDSSSFKAILVLRRSTQPEAKGMALAYIIEVEGSKIFEGKIEKLKGSN